MKPARNYLNALTGLAVTGIIFGIFNTAHRRVATLQVLFFLTRVIPSHLIKKLTSAGKFGGFEITVEQAEISKSRNKFEAAVFRLPIRTGRDAEAKLRFSNVVNQVLALFA